MNLSIIAAIACLVATLAVAFWLGRLKHDRTAFAAVLAAPMLAGLAFLGAGMLARPSAPSATASDAAAATDSAGPASMGPAAETTPAPTPAASGPVAAMRQQAEELRRAKRFAEAREMYAKITKSAPFDADAWADLGDASAAASGGDLKAGVQAIDRALEIDPNHLKALWLKASLNLQEKRYANAIELWQRLLNQLPKDSNDARIVSANLEETRSLAAQQGAAR